MPHSSSNVDVSGEQYPRRRAWSITVDALAIRRLDETAPCAGGVSQMSDNSSAIAILQSRIVQFLGA